MNSIPELENPRPWAERIAQYAKMQTGLLEFRLETTDRWKVITETTNSLFLPRLVDEAEQRLKERRELRKSWRSGFILPRTRYSDEAAKIGWWIGNSISNFFRQGRDRKILRGNVLILYKEARFVRAASDLSDHERSIAIATANLALLDGSKEAYIDLFKTVAFLAVGGGTGAFKLSKNADQDPHAAEIAKSLATLVIERFFKGTKEEHAQWVGESIGNLVNLAEGRGAIEQKTKEIIQAAINIEDTAWARIEHIDNGSTPFKRMDWGKDLYLGDLEDGGESIPIGFAGNESLVTVAQPGAGKTQAHVLPNLLSYEGSIVALDPKLELLEKSGGYRQSQGHRVIVLNLAADDTPTHRFNVMDYIDRRADFMWGSLIEIAGILIPPVPNDNSPIFQQKAAEMVAVCLGVAVSDANERGTEPTLLDAINALFLPKEILCNRMYDIADKIEVNGGCEPLAQSARNLSSVGRNKDTAEDFLRYQSNATSILGRYRGGVINRVAGGASDWRPEDLRDSGTTLYIRIPYEEMKIYGGFVRLILYLTIKQLRRTETEQSGLPVTFLLDEVAQLGNLDTIANVVETGRGFGLRPWMILQDIEQAKSETKRSNLILKTPKLRLHMNPTLESAREISEELGKLNQIITGQEKDLASVSQIVGEPFKDDVILLSSGSRPMRLKKGFAYKHEDFAKITSLPFTFEE